MDGNLTAGSILIAANIVPLSATVQLVFRLPAQDGVENIVA